ncbi:MAG TPA: hypothetical protein VFS89_09335 [Nitrosospira sp.]|nr:hypothetical protein [Nitrosospira sp.]
MKGLPIWIKDHFKQSLDSIEMLMQLVHISERGISVLRGMPQLVKALARDNGEGSGDAAKRIKSAEKEAALAQREVDTDFPVLHGLAAVALWSWLENFVKGFVVLWLIHRKDAYSVPAVQRLRIKLGDYAQLSKAEQAGYVVDLLEQDLSSALKRGITRFESLLDPFSLSGGTLPEGCAQTLFELQQIRNVIAHRNGRADRQLKAACPWLKVRLNQPFIISRPMLHRYTEACIEYMRARLYCVGDHYAIDLRPDNSDEPNSSIKQIPGGLPHPVAELNRISQSAIDGLNDRVKLD